MNDDHRVYAEVLAIRLELEACDVSEVMQWADQMVSANEAPSPAVCELSSMAAAHPLDVAHALRNLPGSVDEGQVGRLLAGAIARHIEADPTTALPLTKALHRASFEERLPPHAGLTTVASSAWTDLCLAIDGFGPDTVEAVIGDLCIALKAIAHDLDA